MASSSPPSSVPARPTTSATRSDPPGRATRSTTRPASSGGRLSTTNQPGVLERRRGRRPPRARHPRDHHQFTHKPSVTPPCFTARQPFPSRRRPHRAAFFVPERLPSAAVWRQRRAEVVDPEAEARLLARCRHDHSACSPLDQATNAGITRQMLRTRLDPRRGRAAAIPDVFVRRRPRRSPRLPKHLAAVLAARRCAARVASGRCVGLGHDAASSRSPRSPTAGTRARGEGRTHATSAGTPARFTGRSTRCPSHHRAPRRCSTSAR